MPSLVPLQAPKCRHITTFSYSGKHRRFQILNLLTLLSAIQKCLNISMMDIHRAKSLGLKILPLSTYNSEILVPTLLQLHCFHRPGGGGYPAPFLAAMHNGAAFFLCDL